MPSASVMPKAAMLASNSSSLIRSNSSRVGHVRRTRYRRQAARGDVQKSMTKRPAALVVAFRMRYVRRDCMTPLTVGRQRRSDNPTYPRVRCTRPQPVEKLGCVNAFRIQNVCSILMPVPVKPPRSFDIGRRRGRARPHRPADQRHREHRRRGAGELRADGPRCPGRKGDDTKTVVLDAEARYFGAALSTTGLVTPD